MLRTSRLEPEHISLIQSYVNRDPRIQYHLYNQGSLEAACRQLSETNWTMPQVIQYACDLYQVPVHAVI